MPQHIGLIGGIGPAATELYYRGLVARHTQAGRRMELTIVHADVRELARNATAGDTAAQAKVYLGLIRRLAAAGAEAAAISSIGGHFCIDAVKAATPIPILDAIPVIGDWVRARPFGKVGILGTCGVMETRIYGAIAADRAVVPAGAEREAVHTHYITMAQTSTVTEPQRQVLFKAGRRLCREQGAEVVLLAGTDLFLAFGGRDPGYPVVNVADIHMDALAQASMRSSP